MSKLMLMLLLAPGCSLPAHAQSQPSPLPDRKINAEIRQQVIEGTIRALHEDYIFPEMARKMETALRERMQRKEYDSVDSAPAFAGLLTSQLQEVSHDKHLRVFFADAASQASDGKPDAAARERYRERSSKRNFGFEKAERLSGNIGYLDLRAFEDPELAGETAAAAMTFLAHSDALIVDLRQNGGGEPAMIALVSSYLFDKRTHLNDIYSRPDNRTEEFWTKDSVPGKKFGGEKPVYVLTSSRTFSGAEEFAYNLKNLKRATIIGEVTGGGAHPSHLRRLNDQFSISVPYARAINPITKTNWEGKGVQPHIEVPAAQALMTAHVAALRDVQGRTADPLLVNQLRNLIASVQRELDTIKPSSAAPKATTGPPQSAATPEQGINLPDTPAGKTLGEFVRAFNTGDLEALRRFHREHGGDPGNADEDMGFFQESGGLILHSVLRAATTEIEVLAQSKKGGRWLNFSIEVGANPPHSIDNIRVQPAAAPADKASPPP
jgi:hypothetical protein